MSEVFPHRQTSVPSGAIGVGPQSAADRQMAPPINRGAEPPATSTKAVAVLALSIVGLVLAPLLGGVIPAAAALILADQASNDLRTADGFLAGEKHVRIGRRIAWIAVWLGILAAVFLGVYFLLNLD